MLEVNGDIEKMVELLGAARSEMVTQLAVAMAITRDARLRGRLGEIAAIDPGQEFVIGQLKKQSWLKVGGNGYTVDRKRQDGLSVVDLDEVLRTLPEFERSLQDSMQRTHATRDSYNILEALFEPKPIQSRSNFNEIFKWAPLLEQIAYKAAMRILQILDTLRSVARLELSGAPGIGATSLHTYWQLVHALGQLTLVASNNEARPWLADMANSFHMGEVDAKFRAPERTYVLACCNRGEVGSRLRRRRRGRLSEEAVASRASHDGLRRTLRFDGYSLGQSFVEGFDPDRTLRIERCQSCAHPGP